MITTLLTPEILVLLSRSNTLKLKPTDKLLLMLKKLLMPGELDSPQAQDWFKDQTQLIMILMALDQETLALKLRINIPQLRLQDKLPLMLKRQLMPGEKDRLQTLDQSYHLFNLEKFQTVILITVVFSLLLSPKLKRKLRILDKLLLINKLLLMHGETDGPPTPAQFSHTDLFKVELSQMDIPSTTISFLIQSRRLTLMPKPQDKLLLIDKLLLMHGETDGPPTLAQSTHTDLFKVELSQMVTPTTTISFLIPSRRLTLMPKPQDKLLLIDKLLLMHGETDGPPTPAQSTHMDLFKAELFQMVTPTTTEFFLPLSTRLTLMLKPQDKLPLIDKLLLMHGEMDGLQTLAQSTLTVFSLKETQDQTQLITTFTSKL